MSQNQSTSPSGLVTMSSVLPVLSIAAVGLRFWVRGRQKSQLRQDDWLMLPALGFFIGMCICAILGVRRRVWGYPTLDPDIDIEAYDSSEIYEGQLLEAFQFIQILTLGCIKLGALLFYRRIFSTGGGLATFDATLYLCIAITILWTIAMTVMNALQCGSHISALWTTSVSEYLEYCIYAFPFVMGFAISNFLLDLLILALPVPKVRVVANGAETNLAYTPQIWSLHTNNARKLGVTGVFGLAIIGLAASAVRMGTYILLTENGPSATADAHLEDTETIFWSNLEGGLSLLAVNLPSLWAIVGTLSVPASQIVASIRSALSLHSFSSGSRHSSPSRPRGASGGGGVVDGGNGFADDSQVRIHDPVKGQSSEWYRLREIQSQETGVDDPRVSDGAGYVARRSDQHDSIV